MWGELREPGSCGLSHCVRSGCLCLDFCMRGGEPGRGASILLKPPPFHVSATDTSHFSLFPGWTAFLPISGSSQVLISFWNAFSSIPTTTQQPDRHPPTLENSHQTLSSLRSLPKLPASRSQLGPPSDSPLVSTVQRPVLPARSLAQCVVTLLVLHKVRFICRVWWEGGWVG